MSKYVKRENGSGTIKARKYASRTVYIALAPAQYVVENKKRVIKREKIGEFNTRTEAKAALAAYSAHPSAKYTYTLEEVYLEWSASAYIDLGDSTKANWTTCWTKICNYMDGALPRQYMRDITTTDIRKLLEHYGLERKTIGPTGELVVVKPLSKSYITKMKALLTQLFDFALANKITDQNYASLAKIPKMEAGTIPPFTNEQFEVLNNGWQNAPGGDACFVLCYTGFRVTEFCLLTKESYNPATKMLCGGIKTEAGKNRLYTRKYCQLLKNGMLQLLQGLLFTLMRPAKLTQKTLFQSMSGSHVWHP